MVAALVAADPVRAHPLPVDTARSAARRPARPRVRRATVATVARELRGIERRLARLSDEQLDVEQDALWDLWQDSFTGLCAAQAVSLPDIGTKVAVLSDVQGQRFDDDAARLLASLARDVRALLLAEGEGD